MAKLQGYDHNIDCIVDPELQDLFNKRAMAKYYVDVDLEYITSLLNVAPEKADNLASRINDSIMEMETNIETIKLAHREYVERILENASKDEEDMCLIIGGCNSF